MKPVLLKALLIAFIWLCSTNSYCQNNFLKVSGEVLVEKAFPEDIRIFVIDASNERIDTVEAIKVLRTDVSRGIYSLTLSLNKKYKIVFHGDTLFQETRWITVSTGESSVNAKKNYSIAGVDVGIYTIVESEGESKNVNRRERAGVIRFNKTLNKFEWVES